MGDKGRHELRERVWIEKFDHSTDTPTLVESAFIEKTYLTCPKCETNTPYDRENDAVVTCAACGYVDVNPIPRDGR